MLPFESKFIVYGSKNRSSFALPGLEHPIIQRNSSDPNRKIRYSSSTINKLPSASTLMSIGLFNKKFLNVFFDTNVSPSYFPCLKMSTKIPEGLQSVFEVEPQLPLPATMVDDEFISQSERLTTR
ncbi:unnamed protein product [Rotaria sp. Silwood2]|nr:unnamed protein product [Rotaria sp. Silwood2]CAF4359273.1 unnamed protein product [Rotaria sp. Silwood2]